MDLQLRVRKTTLKLRPKPTVVQEQQSAECKEEEVVQKIEEVKKEEEDSTIYPLMCSWTLWYGKWDDPKLVTELSTINKFWQLFNGIKAPSKIIQKLEYHLFKTGVRPNAEEAINKPGGSWVLECNRWDVDRLWLHSVLALIGCNFTDHENIVGLVVTCRTQFARIQMWCISPDLEVCKRIGTEWRRLINAESYPVRYHRHEEFYVLQDQTALISFNSVRSN
jgi:translation initiation factor 4E